MESGYAVVFLKAMRDTSIARVSGGACPHDFTYALRFIYIYIYLVQGCTSAFRGFFLAYAAPDYRAVPYEK